MCTVLTLDPNPTGKIWRNTLERDTRTGMARPINDKKNSKLFKVTKVGLFDCKHLYIFKTFFM